MYKLWLSVLVVLTLTACGQSNLSTGIQDPMISASAEGEVLATPDMAVIGGRVAVIAETSSTAMTQARQQMDSIIAYVEQQGIDLKDLHAATVLVQPQWHYPRDKPREITGYQATANFTLKLRDNAKLSSLFGGLIEAGANELNEVRFEFSNYDELELQAIAKAVEKAKRKAVAALSPLGQKVGEVFNLNVDTQWQARPMQRSKMMMAEADSMGSAPRVNVGQQTVKATASVSFYIK